MGMNEKISLFCKEGTADKEYQLQLEETGSGYVVNFQFGRRGSALKPGTRTKVPVPYEKAKKIFDSVVKEKLTDTPPYHAQSSDAVSEYVTTVPVPKVLHVPQLLNEIDEDEVERYLRDDAFCLQEKKDGVHKMLKKTSEAFIVTNKKGISVGYPKSYEDSVSSLSSVHLDGEAIGDTFYVFDLLDCAGVDYRKTGYMFRHNALSLFIDPTPEVIQVFPSSCKSPFIKIVPLFVGYKAKKAEYDRLYATKKEGVVFKRLDAVHTPGKAHEDMVKVKFYATASVIILAHNLKDSIAVGLLDESGKVVGVGNVTTIGHVRPPVNTACEVRYLYCYKGGCLYQPTFLNPRDDVDVAECSFIGQRIKFKPEED